MWVVWRRITHDLDKARTRDSAGKGRFLPWHHHHKNRPPRGGLMRARDSISPLSATKSKPARRVRGEAVAFGEGLLSDTGRMGHASCSRGLGTIAHNVSAQAFSKRACTGLAKHGLWTNRPAQHERIGGLSHSPSPPTRVHKSRQGSLTRCPGCLCVSTITPAQQTNAQTNNASKFVLPSDERCQNRRSASCQARRVDTRARL